MKSPVFKFRSKLWEYPGQAAWHFLTLDKTRSRLIKEIFGGLRRGFGSLRVAVIIGPTKFNTSIFPSSKDGAYILPVKLTVRKAEKLQAGRMVKYQIQLRDI